MRAKDASECNDGVVFMKTHIPREKLCGRDFGSDHFWLLRDPNTGIECIAATPNTSVRFSKQFPESAIPGRGTMVFRLTKEQEQETGYKVMRENLTKGLNEKAAVSVLMDRDRLLQVLEATETPLIRLDFLPEFIEKDNHVQNMVDGSRYISSSRKRIAVDGIRVVEIKAPGDEASEDRACVLGGMQVTTETFIDERKKAVSDALPQQKKKKPMSIREQAEALAAERRK